MENIDSFHKSLIVCDTHCDTAMRMVEGFDITNRSDSGHVDIPRLIEGGLDVQVFACWIGKPGEPKGHYSTLAKKMINAIYTQFGKNYNFIEPVLKFSDIEKSNKNGKIAGIIAIEGGQAIEDDLYMLDVFYGLGVRLMTIVWGSTNWADASREPEKFNGLTDFGKSVIKEMNRLGMIVDVSHSSDKTTWDVLEISTEPIIASHSSAQAICGHPRNVNDDLIKAISQSGGAIFINFCPEFLDEDFWKGTKKEAPLIDKVIEHIDHIANVGGIESVGIGSDYDGMGPAPIGLEDVSKFPNITKKLTEKGYKEDEITKVMGGNFLRVFEKVCNK
ncbi:TPA: membrane dipeptidase [bacterium]|nr:membrane dipeptidase [bacterium]